MRCYKMGGDFNSNGRGIKIVASLCYKDLLNLKYYFNDR